MLKFGLNRAAGPTLTPPTNLVVSNITPAGFKLTWTASILTGATGTIKYLIMMLIRRPDGSSYGYQNFPVVKGTSAVIALNVSAQWEALVVAEVNVSQSIQLNEASSSVTIFMPPAFKPIAPVLSGPTGTNIGLLGATFSWSGSTSNVPLTYSFVVDGKTGPTGITGTSKFVAIPGGIHSSQVVAVAGSTFTPSNTVSVTIPIFKPKAPVLSGPTGSLVGLTGATFSWSGSTSNVPLTYSIIVDGVTAATGITGTSKFGSLLGGTHSYKVLAVAGTTFTPSNTVSVTVPIFKPKAPVLSGPIGADLSGIGATFRWSGSTSNVPLTYSLVVDGKTGPTGLTGTSRFVDLRTGTHSCKVLAVAGSTSTISNTVSVNIPSVFKPKAPVLAGPTGTNIGLLGATFSWSGSTSNVPVTYSFVVDGKTGPTGITKTSSYVPLSVGAHTSKVLAVAGSTFTPSNTVSVTIPIFKPKAPVLSGPTGSNIGLLGATFSWSGSTSNVPLTYSLVVDGKTGPIGITGTSKFVSILGGTHSCQVVAVAGSTSTSSNTVSVNIPIFKPIAPVLSGPTGSLIGVEGVTFSWSGSTSNVPLTYSLVVDGKTGPTELTGTSRFVSLSPGLHTCQVLAVAGSTSTSSNTVSFEVIPITKPTQPVVTVAYDLYDMTLYWTKSTSNVPVRYNIKSVSVYFNDTEDDITDITELSYKLYPNRINFNLYSEYAVVVTAVAGTLTTDSDTLIVNIPTAKPTKPVININSLDYRPDNSIIFTWTASISNVEVQYRITSNGNVLETVAGTGYRITNLLVDIPYSIVVTAIADGKTTESDPEIARIPPFKPIAPVLDGPTGSLVGIVGATFSWSGSTSDVPLTYSFVVDGKTGPTGLTGTSKYVDLIGGPTFSCNVVAIAGSTSTSSNTVSFEVIPITKPTKPVVTPTYGSNSIILNWPESTSNVPVKYKITSNGTQIITDLNATTYTIVDAIPGINYSVVVTAVAGTETTDSYPLDVKIALIEPAKPIINKPTYFLPAPAPDMIGMSLSWSASTSNAPITYDIKFNGSIRKAGLTQTYTDLYVVRGIQLRIVVTAIAGGMRFDSDELVTVP
jgi:hypothetical protein